jgi:hypothetical protein
MNGMIPVPVVFFFCTCKKQNTNYALGSLATPSQLFSILISLSPAKGHSWFVAICRVRSGS